MINPTSNNLSIKTGLSVYLAGSLFSYVGKRYFKINGCELRFQVRAFAISGIIQYVISRTFLENPNRISAHKKEYVKSVFAIALLALFVRQCRFDGVVFKTAYLALGCLLTDLLLEAFIKKNLSPDDLKGLCLNRSLPNRALCVEGDLDFTDQPNGWLPLPKDLRVLGNLDMHKTTREYNGGNVAGAFLFEFMAVVFEWMWTILTLGLENVELISESLPSALHIEGDFDLSNRSSITELPERLHVKGNLNLENCSGLRELPTDLYVGKDLCLENCKSLESLPERLC